MKTCPQCGKQFDTTNTLCPFDGAVLAKADDTLLGVTLAGKYRVDELISEGGMGAVYRATHVLMDKTVAVKVLHPTLAADSNIVARFSREARAASKISHPHALSVTDFGESEDGIVYLVMEYLDGRTLKQVIHEAGPLPLSRVVEICRQVNSALDAAHTEGVVHRDLKSDNIMLVDLQSESDWAKVLDFGIAKIQEPFGQDPALTAPNLIIGTPQYMSPEQCSQAAEIDARSDVYSMGVILFEMLTGHVPFTGDSPTAVMMKHIQDPPPSIFPERKDVPEAVDRVVQRALAKTPEDRFQTAGELTEALTTAAEGPGTTPAIDPALAAELNPGRPTDRIIVATNPLKDSTVTREEELDEETMVRPRDVATTVAIPRHEQVDATPGPAFDLWKIIGVSVAGLVVVFAVVYAITGRTSGQPNVNQTDGTLVSDPNSQPVRAGSPATGAAEKAIVSGVPVPSPTGSPAMTGAAEPSVNGEGGEQPANVNENRSGKEKGNPNQNLNIISEQSNKNADSAAQEEPTPPEANRNSNRQVNPPPPITDEDNSDEPPPPGASPKKKTPTPKPTPPPPLSSQSGDSGGKPPNR
jgi:serine/threonine protein kinase